MFGMLRLKEENMEIKRSVHALTVTFLALFIALPSFASAVESQPVIKPDELNIVALGDSISVGFVK
jgi:hypothetical protein